LLLAKCVIQARTAGAAPFPVREPAARQASIDQREKPDRAEPMLASEPTESTQASEAAEPMDRIEPAEPMDRIDPVEPIDKIDPLEPMLRIEPGEPIDRIEPDAAPALGAEPLLIVMRPLCRNGHQTFRAQGRIARVGRQAAGPSVQGDLLSVIGADFQPGQCPRGSR
jgi:hypothetical protein